MLLNDKQIKNSGAYGHSSNVVFDYQKGNSLSLEEVDGGIIKIISLATEEGNLFF